MPPVVSAVSVDALGPSGPYSSLDRAQLTDIAGTPIGEMTLAPVPYVNRVITQLRKAPTLSVAARRAALAQAAARFRDGVIGGLTLDEYQYLVSRASGLPISTVRYATDHIVEVALTAYERADSARPAGAFASFADADAAGGGLWVRRGSVFGVLAAGNHPAVHAQWLEAVALGYDVIVRPSRREPLTPHRLISALLETDLAGHIAFVPSDYDAADAIMRGADLATVYGGDDVIKKYAADPTVLAQGPGRSKVLITAGADWRDHLDTLVESVASGGGTGCVNATAVLVDGDAEGLAEALASRLAALPILPPEDSEARLPVGTETSARGIADFLSRAAEGSRAVGARDDAYTLLSDGTAVLHPSVHLAPSARSKAIQTELAFPCVWVARWTPDDGLAALGDTLALTIIGADDELIDAALELPAIHNVYAGSVPTLWSAPNAPHDGYLGDFLMRSKAVVRR